MKSIYNGMSVMFQTAEVTSGAVTEGAENTEVRQVTREELENSLKNDKGELVAGGNEILSAFDAGNVKAEHTSVSRNVEGKGKISKDYIRITATSYEGALAMMGGKDSDVWDKFNVGFDMGVRSTLGQQIVREAEGPEKYLDQASKYFAKMFFPGDPNGQEKAKAILQAQLASGALSADTLAAQANAGNE